MDLRLTCLVVASMLATQLACSRESPYAGLETRPIKALSAEEQSDLLEGRGMGLALAAELNRFPGPLHVLELAKELGLSAEQTSKTEDVFERMKVSARELGSSIVELEAELDRRFADRTIETDELTRLTDDIADLRGRLRRAHLAAHLEMVEILDSAQIDRYEALRGYGRRGKRHDPSRHRRSG